MKTGKRPTVAVDFDGVLNSSHSDKLGEPLDRDMNARAFLAALRDAGYRVVMCSTLGRRPLKNWLREHNLFDLVDSVLPIRPEGVPYIDGRAILFQGNYADVLEQLDSFQPWWEK